MIKETIMDKKLKIIIFSTDLVFAEIIKCILDKIGKKNRVKTYRLFSEAKTISENDDVDLIIIDDPIIGTSSYELVSFLRLSQKIICPIIYFGALEYDGEKKAFLAGASCFFDKKFDHNEVGEFIVEILSDATTSITNET